MDKLKARIRNKRYRDKHRSVLLLKRAIWNKKYAKQIRMWAENNQELVSNNKRKYRAANREKIRVSSAIYRQAHKADIRVTQALHRLTHKAMYAALSAKRRAAKLQATPPWLTKEHMRQIEALYVAAERLQNQDGIKRHVDHIYPLQGKTVSGLHVPWNLQILTESENTKKHNKMPVRMQI